MLASVLFILGTRGDKLSALIEFTPMYKTKVSSYHSYLKISVSRLVCSNISWEQVVTIRQL